MCGITGLWRQNGFHEEDLKIAEAMNNTLLHRGPDDGEVWGHQESGIILGHRRLSIIDLSPAGHQPMHSSCGRYVMVYNGETYSNAELSPGLRERGVKFRGHSDTEVMLEACSAYGVEEATKKFVGMFAFALWDKQDKKLYLVRDRLGIKPLYWGFVEGALVFSSELKAFHKHPHFKPQLDRRSLSQFVDFGYVGGAHCIFEGVNKLLPGHIAVFEMGTKEPRLIQYWDALATAQNSLNHQFTDYEEAYLETHTLIEDAVKRRMVADVPLGAFLSGGIDSSLVVGIMQSLSPKPIKTFTIGFEEDGYNEAHHAKEVAKHLGTDHHELYVTSKAAQDVIPLLPQMFDEPFGDNSQIPTYLVSKLAREHVTVSLSGDGGDEFFGGYTRYTHGSRIWNTLSKIPAKFLIRGALQMVPGGILHGLEKILPQRLAWLRPRDRVAKLQDILKSKTPLQFYKTLAGYSQSHRLKMETSWPLHEEAAISKFPSFIEMAQMADTLNYLPEDILTKVDRASMAVSLESRVPLLDHRIFELAWRLPMDLKVSNGKGKIILRKMLNHYVPEYMYERPKMGFGVPIDSWIRKDLKDWAEDLLDEKSLSEIMDPKWVMGCWQNHLKGQNHQYSLWPILMLQAWRRHWGV
jgi:asparagine synthase (glutamine-hydrolysing)